MIALDKAISQLVMDEAPVRTCDGDRQLAPDARNVARIYFYLGFLGLPWLWACSIWLHRPSWFRDSGDPIVRQCKGGLKGEPVC